MLECANCGAAGEDNFSTNYFGELVCELCGTQSFQQARNETQDVDDMAMDATLVSRTHKRASRRRKREPGEPKGRKAKARRPATTEVELLDCLVATQHVLEHQVRALMTRVGGFPPEYPSVVRDLWFHLLESWESKSSQPLLRSYTEYYLRFSYKSESDGGLDRATTQDLLAQWDAERQETDAEAPGDTGEAEEKLEPPTDYVDNDKGRIPGLPRESVRIARTRSLHRFGILDLLPLMWLAARVLSLPLLPCDFAHWVITGEVPYTNLLETCCPPELRARIADVSMFFETAITRNLVRTAKITYSAHCLQSNLELRLPPLNAPLVAHAIAENLGLPPLVTRNFQWITALVNVDGQTPEPPLTTMPPRAGISFIPVDLSPRMLDTGVGIAAHLIVAIKMCPNWFTWIFERVDQAQRHRDSDGETDALAESERLDRADLEIFASKVPTLPRRQLASLLAFCEQTIVDPLGKSVPSVFEKHAVKLQTLDQPTRGSGSSRSRREPKKEAVEPLRTHELRSYPPLYEGGVIVEMDAEIERHLAELRAAQSSHNDGNVDNSDDSDEESKEADGESSKSGGKGGGGGDGDGELQAYFYPVYDYLSVRYAAHPVYENVLEILCEYVDAPMGAVQRVVRELDLRLEGLCNLLATRKYRPRTQANQQRI